MKYLAVAFALLVPGLSIAADPLVRCEMVGPSFGEAKVEVGTDGRTHVNFLRPIETASTYDLTLDSLELQKLRALMGSLPSYLPGQRRSWENLLKVTWWPVSRVKTTELSGRDSPELAEFFHLISNQALAMKRLQQGDVYSVEIAVDPGAAAPKVLQPQVFREPLIEFVRRSDNRGKISIALNALQFLLSPEQFAELAREGIFFSDGSVRTEGGYDMPFGNLRSPARSALMPMYLEAAIRL